MVKYGVLSPEELQRRCEEVFSMNDGDEVYSIRIENGEVIIEMGEVGTKQEGFKWVYFDYKPDMSERPKALDYLMGIRDNFND